MAQMRLASQDDATRHLKLNATRDAADIAHLICIENALADVFEHRCGRQFGVGTVAPITRRVLTTRGNVVVPPVSLRSIVSIAHIRQLDPLVSEPVGTADWFPWGVGSDGGYVGIWFTDSLRADAVLDITGWWSDQDVEDVPADVREAMTLLVIKTWRRYKASPAESVGPDFAAIPTPDGWNDSLVKNAIAHHRVQHRRVGV